MRAIQSLDDGHKMIYLTPAMGRGAYMQVLFYTHYSPSKFQTEPLLQLDGRNLLQLTGSTMSKTGDGTVIRFNRYAFIPTDLNYSRIKRGIFVFPGDEKPPAKPARVVHFPDGSVAYNVLVK